MEKKRKGGTEDLPVKREEEVGAVDGKDNLREP